MTEKAESTIKVPTLKPFQAFLYGRIASKARIVNFSDGRFYFTLVRLPAPDEYASPQTVEIKSRTSLGDVDTDFRGVVDLGGNTYQATPRKGDENGEIKPFRTANNMLTLVE